MASLRSFSPICLISFDHPANVTASKSSASTTSAPGHFVAIHRDGGSEMPLRIAALSIRPSARASARRGERSTKPAPERQTVMSPDFHKGPMRRSVLTRSSSGTGAHADVDR